jgi:fucose permease
MALGACILLISHAFWMSLLGVMIMGMLGSLLLVMVPAALSDHYGEQRNIALTEVNGIASCAAVLASFCVGVGVHVSGSWRSGLLPPLGLLVVLILFLRVPIRDKTESQKIPSSTAHEPLACAFWLYWVVLVLSVAIEFSIIFWGTDVLEDVVGFPRADAAMLVSIFPGAMLVGRLLGSRLVRYIAPPQLLLFSLVIASGGFLLYWIAPLTSSQWSPSLASSLVPKGLALSGLFLTGLGVANLYPLILGLALSLVGTADGASERGSARALLGSAIAIIGAPFLLGWLADYIGIRYASGLILLLLATTFFGVIVAKRKAVSSQIRAKAQEEILDRRFPFHSHRRNAEIY